MKQPRYEKEKDFMATLRGVGCSVGEYAGDGQGEEDEPPMAVEHATEDADPEVDHQYLEEDEDEDRSACMTDDSRPLLVLFDCETTGLSIYSDHITDIGAKVLNPPVPVHVPTFSTLVRTGRTISSTGN